MYCIDYILLDMLDYILIEFCYASKQRDFIFTVKHYIYILFSICLSKQIQRSDLYLYHCSILLTPEAIVILQQSKMLRSSAISKYLHFGKEKTHQGSKTSQHPMQGILVVN